jgi:hypothetical protein
MTQITIELDDQLLDTIAAALDKSWNEVAELGDEEDQEKLLAALDVFCRLSNNEEAN